VDYIRDKYKQARATARANATATEADKNPELKGTCAKGDSLFPEMWGARIMKVSPYHAKNAPPKPNTIDDFVTVLSNTSVGDSCHLHMGLLELPPGMIDDVQLSVGTRPPARGAENPEFTNIWISSGNVLAFEQDLSFENAVGSHDC
jgi:hypothetical protein